MNSINEIGLTQQHSHYLCVSTIQYRVSILSAKYRCHFLSAAYRIHYPKHRTANTLVAVAAGSDARRLSDNIRSQYSQQLQGSPSEYIYHDQMIIHAVRSVPPLYNTYIHIPIYHTCIYAICYFNKLTHQQARPSRITPRGCMWYPK
jgi:hypothetical protein